MSKKNSAEEAQKFAHKLITLLKGKSFQEGHWELIVGFVFFFGGIYLLASYFAA